MVDYHSIRSVHLEISTRCNAACPMCPRNISGYDMDLGYPIHDMRLEEAQKIFTPEFIKQLGRILINGNFGDFVTARDGLAIVQYFSSNNNNLEIEISTNGSAKPKIWTELGKIPNIIVGFALDGLSDTHSLYRRNTDWDLVINNAKNFIAAGGRAIWRMIQFDHNRHQTEKCKALSKKLGFWKFEEVYDGRDSGPVYDKKGNFIYHIGQKKFNYPATALEQDQRTKILNFPESRKKDYIELIPKAKIDCYSNRFAEIYITATGEVYPCCWHGFYPKLKYEHAWQSDKFQIGDLIETNNNAVEVGLESAVNWFKNIENSWNIKKYSEGRLFICDEVCGSN